MKKNNRAFSLIELSIVILIIGILIAGATQGSRVVDASRVQNAQTSTQSSPVSSLRGVVLWLETSQEGSFKSSQTNDGDQLTVWYDSNPQATHGNDFSVSGSDEITYEEKGINNLPTVKFSGSQTAGFAGDEIVTPYMSYTIFAVFRTDTIAKNNILYNGNNGTDGFGIHTNSSGNLLMDDIDGALFDDVVGSTPVIANLGQITTVTISPNSIDGASATQTVNAYVNGLSDDLDTTTSDYHKDLSASLTTPSERFTVGFAQGIGSTVKMDGEISEIIIIDHVLKKSDREAVEAYLGKKYGIAVSKNARPSEPEPV